MDNSPDPWLAAGETIYRLPLALARLAWRTVCFPFRLAGWILRAVKESLIADS